MSMSGGGSASKSHEKSNTTNLETPEYQKYATPIVEGMVPQLSEAYKQSMANYLAPTGYNANQQRIWQQVGNQAQQYGAEGPTGQVAREYLAPSMGEGWMNQLNPYYAAQKAEYDRALPTENTAFWQSMKREMGPLWGRSGRAADQVAEAYGKLKMTQADRLANLYGNMGQAAQTGMQYTGAQAPNLATMQNPLAWGQQAISFAGAPEAEISAEQAAAQAQALPWSQALATLAGLGYQYPISVASAGTSRTSTNTKSGGGGGGGSCCFIMAEAGDLTDTVRWARDVRYGKGSIVARGYKRMAKWLVPLMQQYPAVKFLVKYTMTWPIRKVAEKRIVGRHHPALYPIGFFWEAVWGLYGRI